MWRYSPTRAQRTFPKTPLPLSTPVVHKPVDGHRRFLRVGVTRKGWENDGPFRRSVRDSKAVVSCIPTCAIDEHQIRYWRIPHLPHHFHSERKSGHLGVSDNRTPHDTIDVPLQIIPPLFDEVIAEPSRSRGISSTRAYGTGRRLTSAPCCREI